MKHKVGDFDGIPEDLLMKIHDFAVNQFIPDVLHYLGTKSPMFCKSSIYLVEEYGFEFKSGILEGLVTNEEKYDLWIMEAFFQLPMDGCIKIFGKRLIGSAIRICKTIGKPEHAIMFNEIVRECFTPDEHQDPKDSRRMYFGLPVEPSTGGIQCDCCKGE